MNDLALAHITMWIIVQVHSKNTGVTGELVMEFPEIARVLGQQHAIIVSRIGKVPLIILARKRRPRICRDLNIMSCLNQQSL